MTRINITVKNFYLSRTAFAIDALNESIRHDGRVILDVGFLGEYLEPKVHKHILEAIPIGDRVVAMDTNQQGLQAYLQQNETRINMSRLNIEYRASSLFDECKANEYDVVFLLEVIEHLSLPYLALNHVHEILKPGGILIMTYPNPLSLMRMIRYIAENNPVNPAFMRAFLGNSDHKIFPHPVCLAAYLNRLALVTKRIAYIKHDLTLSLVNNLMLRLHWTRKFASYIGLVAEKTI